MSKPGIRKISFLKRLEINLIMVICLILLLFFVPKQNKAEEVINLKYQVLDQETILVQGGLLYKSNIVLDKEYTMHIDKIITETKIGFAFMAGKGSTFGLKSEKGRIFVNLEEPSLVFHSFTTEDDKYLIDAINFEWVFAEPNMSFPVGQYKFKTKKAGATLKFTKEGIVLTGFEINRSE